MSNLVDLRGIVERVTDVRQGVSKKTGRPWSSCTVIVRATDDRDGASTAVPVDMFGPDKIAQAQAMVPGTPVILNKGRLGLGGEHYLRLEGFLDVDASAPQPHVAPQPNAVPPPQYDVAPIQAPRDDVPF